MNETNKPQNPPPDEASGSEPQIVARTSARSATESTATTTSVGAAPLLTPTGADLSASDLSGADSFDVAESTPPLGLDVSADAPFEAFPNNAEPAGFEAAVQYEEEVHDKELDLLEHLGELRTRLLKSIAAVFVCLILTWQFRDALLAFFSKPIVIEIRRFGGKLVTSNPAEGFGLYLQITLAAAIILAIPIIIYQAWAFIEPALTRQERRYGATLVPFSIVLFFTGGALGFWLTPLFFRFFLQFQPPDSESYWSYGAAASLLAKMLLVFGVCFQVPVVTVFLNKIGLMSRNWMIEYWRHVVVVMFVIVAVITPTWDPLTLCAAAAPPCVLYGASIWLVKWL
ncbi:MAG TPA: twin-arginine translocase subunit TatC [Abditibacteriaceae bacterium]|jgi:sec-independent protein translocase protein TatC